MAQSPQDSQPMSLHDRFEAWSYGAVAALVLATLCAVMAGVKDSAHLEQLGWNLFRSLWFDAAIVFLLAALFCLVMIIRNDLEWRRQNRNTKKNRRQTKHVFNDGDWAEWTEFPGSEYKLADLQKYGKGPFRLSRVDGGYAKPEDALGSLWDIRYFKPAAPPARTKA